VRGSGQGKRMECLGNSANSYLDHRPMTDNQNFDDLPVAHHEPDAIRSVSGLSSYVRHNQVYQPKRLDLG
jgi:hypothetical protein